MYRNSKKLTSIIEAFAWGNFFKIDFFKLLRILFYVML